MTSASLSTGRTRKSTRSFLTLEQLTLVEQLWEQKKKRRSAASSLIEFTEFTNPNYTPAQHHRRIAEKLEAVERGEIDRLAIFMPPRHGKSELASRRFPAWYLGRNSDKQIIAASYNSDLASDFGRDVRNIVDSKEYGAVFRTRLREDSRAAERWNTDDGGSYVAAGVGTAVTGRGAHVLLIDDPLKDREEADSDTRRQRVWDWYTSTAYTRLMPGGSVILIQTRWHEDDLAGRLLNIQGADRWEVLDLPATDREGRALWPEWYDEKALARIRAAIGPRDWSALYQQKPSPETGEFFRADWLHPYDRKPARETLQVYGGSDYATTADGGDYTVHVVFGIDPDGNPWLLDCWRKQASSDEWVAAWCDLVLKWKPLGWAEETGQIKSSIGPYLDRESRARKAYCAREAFTPGRRDKATRAQSFRGYAAQYGIYVPSAAPWWPECRRELLTFPAGVHDDFVDACALVFLLLDKMVAGQKPKAEEPDHLNDAYRSREDEFGESSMDYDKTI